MPATDVNRADSLRIDVARWANDPISGSVRLRATTIEFEGWVQLIQVVEHLRYSEPEHENGRHA